MCVYVSWSVSGISVCVMYVHMYVCMYLHLNLYLINVSRFHLAHFLTHVFKVLIVCNILCLTVQIDDTDDNLAQPLKEYILYTECIKVR